MGALTSPIKQDREEITMPELPDIVVLARSMNEALCGRVIREVVVNQPKCLNIAPDELGRRLAGRRFESFEQRGKWILARLDDGSTLAFNLGMGGEMVLHRSDEIPDPARERVVLRFADGEQLWIHHWWFGHVHYIPPGEVEQHPQIGRLGIEPLNDEFTVERLANMLAGKRGRIKSYLLDQSFIAGIGNVYVQDTLWLARLHPERRANTLSDDEIAALHRAIRHVLRTGIEAGGGPGEKDVYGQPGRYDTRLQVGYRTGKPCPDCGTIIEELRVGQTTSYICPHCQPLV
jgi:formamidopyrimidine-DNA glycosylase